MVWILVPNANASKVTIFSNSDSTIYGNRIIMRSGSMDFMKFILQKLGFSKIRASGSLDFMKSKLPEGWVSSN